MSVKILQIVLGVIITILAGYSLITGMTDIGPYLLLLMSGLVILIGINEYQKRKPAAFTLFLSAGFTIFVAVYIL